MMENAIHRESIQRVRLQNTFDEIHKIVFEIRSEVYWLISGYVIHFLTLRLPLKWRISMNKFIKENTQRPNINFKVMRSMLHHLRCHIIDSPTECCTRLPSIGIICTPTKITYFYVIICIHKQILWLEKQQTIVKTIRFIITIPVKNWI